MAAEFYTPDGFAKQIDTYKDLALSASNAIKTNSWGDSISVASSVADIQNCVDWSGAYIRFFGSNSEIGRVGLSVAGTFSFRVPSGKTVSHMDLYIHPQSLPMMGNYRFNLDFASDTTLTYSGKAPATGWFTFSSKAQPNITRNYSFQGNTVSGGDVFAYSNISLQSSVSSFAVQYQFSPVSANGVIGGKFKANFNPSQYSSSGSTTSPGTAPSNSDIQSGIASTTTQIASSVNEVYESIQQLMQHISNQLAALWDQIYNYCHVPTYNKLQEILLSIQNISMGSDLQKIADQISNSTTEQTNDLISNANSNQEKTDQAIQKHGNFIIEGLKSLFIPSDEYFNAKFSDLNEFFKDRFGFLYTPIDLLVRFVNLIYGASDTFDGIPFPELSWDGHVLLAAQTVKFDILDIAAFKQVQKYLYFLTDVMMIGALVSLIHRKFEEVMQN